MQTESTNAHSSVKASQNLIITNITLLTCPSGLCMSLIIGQHGYSQVRVWDNGTHVTKRISNGNIGFM